MPNQPNARTAREFAAAHGVDLNELRSDEKTTDKRLSAARKAFAAAVADGSVEDV